MCMHFDSVSHMFIAIERHVYTIRYNEYSIVSTVLLTELILSSPKLGCNDIACHMARWRVRTGKMVGVMKRKESKGDIYQVWGDADIY